MAIYLMPLLCPLLLTICCTFVSIDLVDSNISNDHGRPRHGNLSKRQTRTDATVLITGENTDGVAREGDSVTLHCIADVANLRQVTWSFGGSVNLTVDDTVVIAEGDPRASRIFIAKNHNPPRITTFSLTISDVTGTDAGKYKCDVAYGYDEEFQASAEIYVPVMYFPRSGFPICSARGGIDTDTWVAGQSIDLECQSEKGNPEVTLAWAWHKDERPQIPTFIQQGTFASNLMLGNSFGLIAHRVHEGDVFVCNLTSVAYPERQRSCQIGPITVFDQGFEPLPDDRSGAGFDGGRGVTSGAAVNKEASTMSTATGEASTMSTGEASAMSTGEASAMSTGVTAGPADRDKTGMTTDEKINAGINKDPLLGELEVVVIITVAIISVAVNVFLAACLLKLKLCRRNTEKKPESNETRPKKEVDPSGYMAPNMALQPRTPADAHAPYMQAIDNPQTMQTGEYAEIGCENQPRTKKVDQFDQSGIGRENQVPEEPVYESTPL